MSKILLVLGCLALVGCTTVVDEGVTLKDGTTNTADNIRRFVSLRQVHEGMTRKEVQGVLNNKVVVGYEMVDEKSGQYKPITIDNPYRTENIEKGSAKYCIEYYLEKIKSQDGIISDDELVPLVFRDDKLVAQGWDFITKSIKN